MDEALTKVTVYLTPWAMKALDAAVERSGDTRTNTINWALMMYDKVTLALETVTEDHQ